MIRLEQRCEGKYTRKTIQHSVERNTMDFEGRMHDLGPNTKEQPGIVQAEISCSARSCPLKPLSYQAEAEGPFGAINKANEQMRQYILDNCPKAEIFRQRHTPSYYVPSEFFPQG